jgi:hypothetical protein
MDYKLKRLNRLSCIVILIILIMAGFSFTPMAFAIVPEVQDVVVWSKDGDTILNVTVYHDPDLPPSHYADFVEVDIGGNIQTFPISQQNGTTFVVQCNLGSIEGTPLATVKAHCTIHDYSPSSDPIEIPEFSLLSFLLALSIITIVVFVVFRKMKPNSCMQTRQKLSEP